jgi:hypothetical protein
LLHHKNNQSFQDPKGKVTPEPTLPSRLGRFFRHLFDLLYTRAPVSVQNLWIVIILVLCAAPMSVLRYEVMF